MEKLQEDIKTFNNWVNPARKAKADAAYATKATTQDGQLQILGDASDGNSAAADFLFDLFKKIISKAFWKYYMGPDKSFYKSRIDNGADKDFASMAYEMLLGGGDPSPYETFKPSKFSSKADLLKQFGYYLYRYMQNEAFKMIRAEKMGGMTGNVKHQTGAPKKQVPAMQGKGLADDRDKGLSAGIAGDASVVGYEDHFENDEETSTPDSFTDDIELRETIRAFLKHLKTVKPLYHDVFYAKLQGMGSEAVADKLGISGQSVRNHLKAIKTLYDDFTGGSN